jgi:signal recognition particle subunit SRP54
MKAALREIKLSLLEADVNYKVVKEFTEKVRAQSLGSEVAQSLSPYQQVVKIVRSELEAMLGGSSRELKTSSVKPAVIMMTGLQGTGKTTSTGKLALHLRQQGRSVLLCSIDLKRLAAVEQLRTIADEMQLPFFEPKGDNPVTIGKNLLAYAREYDTMSCCGYCRPTSHRRGVDDDCWRCIADSILWK